VKFMKPFKEGGGASCKSLGASGRDSVPASYRAVVLACCHGGLHVMLCYNTVAVRFKVLMAVKMTMLYFWFVTQCRLVGRYKRFGTTYCLHLQG
jgi:hypothetical protein